MSGNGAGAPLVRLVAAVGLVGCMSTADLPLTPVESGVQSNVTAQAVNVVSHIDSFRRLYADIHAHVLPPRRPPAIDFDKDVALVAFLGRRSTGGHGISFGDTVTINDRVATVSVIVRSPPADAVLPSLVTTPYAIATLKRGDYDLVVFADSSGTELGRVALT